MSAWSRYCLALILCSEGVWAGDFSEPLDTPAARTALGAQSTLLAVRKAGGRFVAVGARGLVITSDDQARTWQQASVPVSSDLTTVFFLTPQVGWAAGHDGVVLKTEDGGKSWAKRLDGRQAQQMLSAHFEEAAKHGDATAQACLDSVQLSYADGPAQPILDLSFTAQDGYASSTFGTLLRTSDGGKTWGSFMEELGDDRFFHLTAMALVGNDLYIASEQGTVYRRELDARHFTKLSTGYGGTMFGIVGNASYILAFGMEGKAFRSRDRGATWQELLTGVIGGLSAGTIMDNGTIVLTTVDGSIIASRDEGAHFSKLAVSRPTLFTGLTQAGPTSIVAVGLSGVQLIDVR